MMWSCPRPGVTPLVLAACATASWLIGCSPRGDEAITASSVEPPRTADMGYRPRIPDVAYAEGGGPVVCVDETHNNFHTSVGTYRPFADVLRRDGYVVERFTEGGEAAPGGDVG